MPISNNGLTSLETYSQTISFVVASSATDIFTLTGSATKTVKILKVGIAATQQTSSIVTLFFLKRSTANSGGSTTTTTIVPFDSDNSAATAIARGQLSNPTTLGTLVGNIKFIKCIIPTVSTVTQPMLVEQFGATFGQPIVLRGTNESFSINLNGVTVTNNTFSIWIEWTEE